MISIITPCKNIILEGREKVFRKMMKTLSEQSYKNFEHILVDSDSQDGTADLLKEYYKKELIDLLIIEKDNNLHEAINKGFKYVKGKYIHVMNTDDYFSTNLFFENSLKELKKNNVDFTHADRKIIKRNGSFSSIQKKNKKIAFFRMPFNWQTMIIKKEIYDEIGPLDEKYEIASDYKFMMKMLLARKKGFYFPKIFIHALNGGITTDRQKCIDEVTSVIYETYGQKYGLSYFDCQNIYLRKISSELFEKVNLNVKDNRIINSIKYCYEIIQPYEKNGGKWI